MCVARAWGSHLTTFKSCSEYLRAELCKGKTCPHQLSGIQLVEDNSIAILFVVDNDGLETKRCLECQRGHIIGRNFVFLEGMIRNKKQ